MGDDGEIADQFHGLAVSFTAPRDAKAGYRRNGDISRSLSHGLGTPAHGAQRRFP
jgi:hypothetical protein